RKSFTRQARRPVPLAWQLSRGTGVLAQCHIVFGWSGTSQTDVGEAVANILIEKATLRLCRHQLAMSAMGRAKVLVDFSAAKLQFQQILGFIVSHRSQSG